MRDYIHLFCTKCNKIWIPINPLSNLTSQTNTNPAPTHELGKRAISFWIDTKIIKLVSRLFFV